MNRFMQKNGEPEYEHGLRRQVGAPLWFSPTKPLNTNSLGHP